MSARNTNKIGLLVFLFALLTGVFFYFFVFDSMVFVTKYWELGLRFRGELWPPIEVFYSSPFYVVLTAAVQGFPGMNLFLFTLVQILVGAINCRLIYRLGLSAFDRRTALAAALAAAVYLPFILYNATLMPAVWITFFNLLALLAWFAYRRDRKLTFLAAAGAMAGLSVVCRASFALFVLALGGAIFFDRSRPGALLRLKALACFLLPAALAVLPVSLFNYLRSGELIPVTASGGWVFYCSNNPNAPGFAYTPPPEFQLEIVSYYARPGPRLSYVEHLLSRELAQKAAGTRLGHRQASRYWTERARDFARRRPLEFAGLMIRKLLYSLNGYEPHDLPEVLHNRARATAWPLLTPRLILPLALAGLILCRPRRPVLELYLLSYLLFFLATYVIPRYRVPLGPVLLLYAAAGAVQTVAEARSGRWKRVALYLVLLVPLFALANLSTPQIRSDRLASRPAFLKEWRGLVYLRAGAIDEARREFAAALELNPASELARRGWEAASGNRKNEENY